MELQYAGSWSFNPTSSTVTHILCLGRRWSGVGAAQGREADTRVEIGAQRF